MAGSALYEIFRVRYFAAAVWVAASFAACASGAGGGRSTDECSDACAKVGAADCGDVGSECVEACVRASAPTKNICSAELLSYSDCFWSAASYVCDDVRGTTAPDCEEQLRKYQGCPGNRGEGGGAGDGGGSTEGGAAGASTNDAAGAGGATPSEAEPPSGAGGA